MITLFWIWLQVFGLYLLADFVAGIFHWAEDTLGADDTPIWGPLFAAPNSAHHTDPSAMNKIHWFKNNALLFGGAIVLVAGAWAVGEFSWQLAVFAFFGALTQQAHRFSHAPRLKLPGWVLWLQKMRILQDARHHWKHHTSPHTTHYCPLTTVVNPVLDRIRFWRGMERIFVPIFGAPRRPDLMEKQWYRAGPFWAVRDVKG